jgi:hypothetical protein
MMKLNHPRRARDTSRELTGCVVLRLAAKSDRTLLPSKTKGGHWTALKGPSNNSLALLVVGRNRRRKQVFGSDGTCSGLHVCSWGWLNSNQRPTDYEFTAQTRLPPVPQCSHSTK